MNPTLLLKKSIFALSLAGALVLSACGAETSTSASTSSVNDGAAVSGEGAAGPPADGGQEGTPSAANDGPASQGAAADLTEAAKTLGVSVAKLDSALGGPPPDFDSAAKTLGVSVDELMAALPATPTPAGDTQPAGQ